LNSRGYTLLEVSLFLAISGALTAVAIVSLAPRLTNVRFSTAVRDLQDNVSKQLNTSELGESSNTKNYTCEVFSFGDLKIDDASGGGGGSSDSCVLVGKLAVFEKAPSNQVTYRSIVAARTPKVTASNPPIDCRSAEDSFDTVRNCYQPRVLPNNLESPAVYAYSSGLQQKSEIRGYGFIRSPRTNQVFRFSMTLGFNQYERGPGLNDNDFIAFNKVKGVQTDTFPICMELGNRTAQLLLYKNKPQPQTVFNEACT